MMKTRPHHNNKGERQIKRGKTAEQIEEMAKRLGIKFKAFKHGEKDAGELSFIPNHLKGVSSDN